MNYDMLLKYEPLIASMTKKFYGAEKEDLMQAGYLGLIKAYQNFDFDMDTAFSSYAYKYIIGEMYDIMKLSKNMKFQKSSLALYQKVNKVKELLEQKYQREVSYREVVDYLKVDYNMIVSIFNSLSATLDINEPSIDIPVTTDYDNQILIEESLNNLTPEERLIIKSRYMLDLSQQELADKLGISQSKISRIERQGKIKIKKFIR